jgi:hypothetical protein
VIVVLKKDSLPHADLCWPLPRNCAPHGARRSAAGRPGDPADAYHRPGLYVLRAPEELADVEFGLRMINAGKLLRQCTVLGFDNRRSERGDGAVFRRQVADRSLRPLRGRVRRGAHRRRGSATDRPVHQRCEEQRDITEQSLENAARAHFALKKILVEERPTA